MAKQNRPARRIRNRVVRKTTVSTTVSSRLEIPPPGHPDWKNYADRLAAFHTHEFEDSEEEYEQLWCEMLELTDGEQD